MSDNSGSSGYLGAILGGIIALAVLMLVISGGEWTGKTTVRSDQDLPPVTSGSAPPR